MRYTNFFGVVLPGKARWWLRQRECPEDMGFEFSQQGEAEGLSTNLFQVGKTR